MRLRVQGIAGIAVPYFELIRIRSVSARRRWLLELGCTPSRENARPNGRRTATVSPAFPWGKYANCRTWAVSVESAANLTLGSRYAQPRAVACEDMYVLYAITAPTNLINSFGTMSAAIGAQLLLTVNVGGNAAPGTRPFLIAQYVAPRLKYGMPATLPTPISTTPCGPAASIVSSSAP